MKARVKATGEIVDIFFHDCNKEGICFYYTENYEIYAENEIEIIHTKDPDYWEKLKHQYAGMAMQGMLANEYAHKLYLDNKNYPNDLLNDSIAIATALVEKLKNDSE